MKKILCLIIILLFPVPANSQPDYNYIKSDFDTLFMLQTNNYLEMQGILKSYGNSDSNSRPQRADIENYIDKIFDEWTELDSLIKRANSLIFPNYSRDYQKISALSKMIDSASNNYRMNLQVSKEICTRYSDFDADDLLKIRLDELSTLRLPAFKPRTIK
jgi:hypothetical protein